MDSTLAFHSLITNGSPEAEIEPNSLLAKRAPPRPHLTKPRRSPFLGQSDAFLSTRTFLLWQMFLIIKEASCLKHKLLASKAPLPGDAPAWLCPLLGFEQEVWRRASRGLQIFTRSHHFSSLMVSLPLPGKGEAEMRGLPGSNGNLLLISTREKIRCLIHSGPRVTFRRDLTLTCQQQL